MDLSQKIQKHLGLDVQPGCEPLLIEAIKAICEKKGITDCRITAKSGALLLLPRDIPVAEIKTCVQKKFGELKALAAAQTAFKIPSRIVDDVFWSDLIGFLRKAEKLSLGKMLFAKEPFGWDKLRDYFRPLTSFQEYVSLKYHFSEPQLFAAELKKRSLGRTVKIELTQSSIDKFIKDLLMDEVREIDWRFKAA